VEHTIEIMLDQLATDERFLQAFEEGAAGTPSLAGRRSLALTPFEVRALLSPDASIFEGLAQELDSRIKKDSLLS
jgi:hypothetical protein